MVEKIIIIKLKDYTKIEHILNESIERKNTFIINDNKKYEKLFIHIKKDEANTYSQFIKMKYKKDKNDINLIILNRNFISYNKKKCKLIIENKKKDLKEIIKIKEIWKNNEIIGIKLQYLDYIINMNSLFEKCSSLIKIRNIDKLNTNKICSVSALFYRCSLLQTIPDISKWNINNITDRY